MTNCTFYLLSLAVNQGSFAILYAPKHPIRYAVGEELRGAGVDWEAGRLGTAWRVRNCTSEG